MDPMVKNDTALLSWNLDKVESQLLLETLFPEASLFRAQYSSTSSQSPHITLLDFVQELVHDGVYGRQGGSTAQHWPGFPDPVTMWTEHRNGKKINSSEQRMANFLNDLLRRAKKFGSIGDSDSYASSMWTGAASTLAPTGAEVKPIAWRDILAIGEMKNRSSDRNTELSYVEVAGKTSTIFYSQDGRYAVSSLRILGTTVIFTFIDKGGSILGFDPSIIPRDDGHKEILVGWKGNESTQMKIIADSVIFASDALHTRGTTVWSGTLQPDDPIDAVKHVIVKDSWIDPLREYTEGATLKRLNTAKVQGVPRLVHEEQVKMKHPKSGIPVNASTHLLRAVLNQPNGNRPYQLRVLSRLTTEPTGKSIMEISCLAELIIVYIDYILSHKDALEKTGILHCDITLMNLFIVEQKLWAHQQLDFLEMLPVEKRQNFALKILQLPHRGLLSDWGYSVLYQAEQLALDPAAVDILPHEAQQRVPVMNIKSDCDQVHYVGVSDLETRHNIVLPMARNLPDAALPRINIDPLHRTANWSWMAAQLMLAGPGKPVSRTPMHDLESFFYVILGFCLLYDEPYKVKSDEELSQCYDLLFNKSSPSLDKTTIIQSSFGWTTIILPFISQYFKPLVPLLQNLRENIIMPLSLVGGEFHTGNVTHDEVVGYLLAALDTLDDHHWVPHCAPDTNQTHDKTEEDKDKGEEEGKGEDEDEEDDEEDGQPSEHIYIRRIPPIRPRDGPGFTRKRATRDDTQPPVKRPRR
ncbi:hypothetical protein L210DRAFT_3530672 [Boletus edulis BED1]|uniref:Fungal-type protein kinase domain-containing protein n=1 Tax=Boletus edulis BED1 TaxID=1328754 RepID=A0AAD4C0N5_BOLED|nr:hypothetical protein L210DRAFT_3530672 [Boletus edulis BED1]